MSHRYILAHKQARMRAVEAISNAPDGWHVSIKAPTRKLGQNSKFHAICNAAAKAGFVWAGKKRTSAQIKVLLISGHAVATNEEHEIIPGLEGEFVNVRESSAEMSVPRSSSLIDYSLAFFAMAGIDVSEQQEVTT